MTEEQHAQLRELAEPIRLALSKLPPHWHYHERAAAALDALLDALADAERERDEALAREADQRRGAEYECSRADALAAERDEWRSKFYAENQNWTRMYEDERKQRARADALAAELAEARQALFRFKRMELKGTKWPADWLGPCFCRELPMYFPPDKRLIRGHDERCLATRAALRREGGNGG